MNHRLLLLLVLLLAAAPLAEAQVAPAPGVRFPAGFWEKASRMEGLDRRADPSWAERMRRRKADLTSAAKNAGVIKNDRFSLPVLLGSFSDVAYTHPASEFQTTLWGANPNGNLTDYYKEVSYGKFELTGAVHGWFKAPENRAYYASNNHGSNNDSPRNAQGFVQAIVRAADASVNFALFDNDGPDGLPNSGDDDGEVDAVAVVFAGEGADSGGESGLWPHAGALPAAMEVTTNDPAAGGGFIKVSRYFIAAERNKRAVGAARNEIGVFAHEFGHVLGLPDLYDRDGEGEEESEGSGNWDLMAGGSWGSDGRHPDKPAHLSAWGKYEMGWLNPVIPTAPGALTLRDAETYPEAYLFWEDGFAGTRYFLVENRQRKGSDKYLPGSGMLIYHVDELQRHGAGNVNGGLVNNDEFHKFVDIEEADALADLDNGVNRGDAGDPFPGSSGNRAFSDATNPSARDYTSTNTGFALENITENEGVVTADYRVRAPLGYYIKYDYDGISGWGYGSETPKDYYGRVRFTAAEAGRLSSIDIGLRDDQTSYELRVFAAPWSSAAKPLYVTQGIGDAGWHTVPLAAPIELKAGADFYVVIKIIEKPYAMSFARTKEHSGRSQLSEGGSIFTRPRDFTGDLNLRARVQTSAGAPVASEPDELPQAFTLEQNYPNPFNPSTTIAFETPRAAYVRLRLFDALGREAASLADGMYARGRHEVTWNAAGMPSGLYFYRLETEAGVLSKSLMLVK